MPSRLTGSKDFRPETSKKLRNQQAGCLLLHPMTKDCHGTTAEERLASGDHLASKQWYSLQFYYTRPIVFDIRWKSTNNRWDAIQALGYWWNIGYIGYDDNSDTKPNFSGGSDDLCKSAIWLCFSYLFTTCMGQNYLKWSCLEKWVSDGRAKLRIIVVRWRCKKKWAIPKSSKSEVVQLSPIATLNRGLPCMSLPATRTDWLQCSSLSLLDSIYNVVPRSYKLVHKPH